MKALIKVCRCGRFFKWGKWYRYEELSNRDKIQLITAYTQYDAEEIVCTCDVCKEVRNVRSARLQSHC